VALDHLVEELYRDVERLRDELSQKGDELDEGRRQLAERGRQLGDQRKETERLVQLLEQQEAQLAEAITQIKSLREQSAQERDEAREREATRFAFVEHNLRAVESERDQLRRELHALQAAAAANGSDGSGTGSLAPLMAEFGDMRRQISETQTQLGDARTQLSAAIERAAMPAAGTPPPVAIQGDAPPVDDETRGRLATIERERVELESELELVRTRATELQEVVNQQRRELVEQRADITTELRLLRELVEQRHEHSAEAYESDEDAALVGAPSRGEPMGSAPDPVVSSVMAQFARLQKDVAQRRKKK
jgi:chromosome segregation ATPase